MSLLAELLELLVPALELMADEAASLGLEVNWQKTNIQALRGTEGVPLTVTVKDHEVAVAEEFVYLGSLIHSSVQSTHDINRRSAIARAALQSLDNQIFRSRVSTSTKLKLYNTCFLLWVRLLGSLEDRCTEDDAFDQWYLCIGIKWQQFVRNNEVRRLTGQPKLTAIVQSRHLTVFGHTAHMDDNVDAKGILSTVPPEDWTRPRGRLVRFTPV